MIIKSQSFHHNDWLFIFSYRAGYVVDFPLLRKLHRDFMDFDSWLERTGRLKFAALLSS
jgi:hypothetical protein